MRRLPSEKVQRTACVEIKTETSIRKNEILR